jgi:hypothetical protein
MNKQEPVFDFDEWKDLAIKDPQTFEKRRQEVLEAVIASAEPDSQQRLRGLQWRLDLERQKVRDPLQSCQRVFDQMWEGVYGKNGLLHALNYLLGKEPAPPISTRRASVLPFRNSESGKDK